MTPEFIHVTVAYLGFHFILIKVTAFNFPRLIFYHLFLMVQLPQINVFIQERLTLQIQEKLHSSSSSSQSLAALTASSSATDRDCYFADPLKRCVEIKNTH